jgi:signal transduction histidine kinase
MIPLGIALAAFASWLLVRSVLAPVDRVTEEALRLAGNDDLSGRLQVVGDDEVSRLGGALNSLLSRIQTLYAQEKQARKTTEKSLEAQKRFVSDASHELRTPLTRISLAAHNALSAKDEQSRSKALESIHRSSGQMSRLVSHLLALARMDAGQAGLTRQPFDLGALASQAVEEAGDPRITFRGQGAAIGDPDAFRRILDNLIENARRHTPDEGSITVEAQEDGDRTSVVVIDTGEGIPPDAITRIGTRFFRVDESRSRSSGGTGLGLALSMELAQAMGGSLFIASDPGQGVRATLSLVRA